MATFYYKELEDVDFCDLICFCNEEGAEEWEQFVDRVAGDACEETDHDCTDFELFLMKKGYNVKIWDLLYDAMKAYTNERIIASGKDFPLI